MEFALAMPIFLLLTYGIIEFGRVMYTDHLVENAAQEAARYAIVHGAESTDPATATDIEGVAKSRTLLDPAKMTVSTSFDPDNKPGSVVSVEVNYDFRFVINLLSSDPISLSSTSEMVISN